MRIGVLTSPLWLKFLFDELIIELNFGEGGDDSKKFVEQLTKAYFFYISNNNLKYEILEHSFGHIIIKTWGKNALKFFENETGQHCVQRYPDNDRGGRRHTSLISVVILPLPPENKLTPIPETDLEVIFQRRGGKGGQHQNKVSSAVRMRHRPTGINVLISGRDQYSNRKEALRIITTRVNNFYAENKNKNYQDLKMSRMDGGGRGIKIRTYNFIDHFVKDHKLGTKTGKIDDIMRGKFDLLFK